MDRIVGMVVDRCCGGRLDRPAQGVSGALVDLLDGVDLRGTETRGRLGAGALQRLTGIRKHKSCRIELGLACRQIIDDTVGGSVEPVASGQNGARDKLLVRLRKCRVQQRAAVRKLLDRGWRDGRNGLHAPILGERNRFQIIDRVSGHDAVEVVGKVLGKNHALATARGTADEVGMVRTLAIVGINQKFSGLRRDVDRTVGMVRDCLRIEKELVGNGQVFVLVPAVLACYGEAAGQCGR